MKHLNGRYEDKLFDRITLKIDDNNDKHCCMKLEKEILQVN